MNVLLERSVVYCFENKLNGKKYVGLTSQRLDKRINGHKSSANNGSQSPFHNALRKYGIDGQNNLYI